MLTFSVGGNPLVSWMLKSKKLDLMTVTLHFTEVLQKTIIFIKGGDLLLSERDGKKRGC
jgi:hypothetical protein